MRASDSLCVRAACPQGSNQRWLSMIFTELGVLWWKELDWKLGSRYLGIHGAMGDSAGEAGARPWEGSVSGPVVAARL